MEMFGEPITTVTVVSSAGGEELAEAGSEVPPHDPTTST